MGTFLKGGSAGDRMRKLGGTEKKKKKRVNKSYQRFFDGYIEMYVPRENGKGEKIERVYVADYHDADLSKGKKWLLRITHCALLALAFFVFACGALLDAKFNNRWFGVIPEAGATGLLCLGVITMLFRYIPSMGRMTNWEFKQAVGRYGWILKLSPWFLWASAFTALVSIPFYPSEYKKALLGALYFILSGGIMWFAKIIESKVPYILIPSGKTAPIGSVDIATMKEVTPPKKIDPDNPGGYALDELEFEPDDDDTPEPRYW